MFSKDLALGAKALLVYHVDLLKDESPLPKKTKGRRKEVHGNETSTATESRRVSLACSTSLHVVTGVQSAYLTVLHRFLSTINTGLCLLAVLCVEDNIISSCGAYFISFRPFPVSTRQQYLKRCVCRVSALFRFLLALYLVASHLQFFPAHCLVKLYLVG